MEERRKAKRMPATMSLEILNLYKQDNVMVSDIHAPIEAVDISQTGIGFVSKSTLPIGFYFNANINLGDEETLHCVVQIIRSKPTDDGNTIYGCEFIGMATVLSYIFDQYDKKISEEK